MRHFACLGIGLFVLLSGCQAKQVRNSTVAFRGALLDVYTEQAMDNLIRARNYQPFVQLKFRDMLVQNTDKLEGSTSVSQTAMTELGMINPITKFWNVAGNGSRSVILSFKADPVTDQNDVYDKYLEFAHNPYYFQVAPSKPDFPVHICKQDCELYYFVPIDAAPAFQMLLLETTFQRGTKKDPLTELFLRRTVTRVVKAEENQGLIEDVERPVEGGNAPVNGAEDGQVEYRIFFNAPVINSNAFGFVEIAGKRARLDFRRVDDPSLPDDQTPFLRYVFDDNSIFEPNDLKNREVLLILEDVPPGTEQIPASETTQQIKDSLDRIEANVLVEPR